MKFAPTPLAFQGRIFLLAGMVTTGFLIVLVGYFRVQILNQERYEALGEKYRTKKARSKATRGLIYDRNDRLITQNMPTYNLVLLRDEMVEPWRLFLPRIREFLGEETATLEKRYGKRSHLFSQPVLLQEDIGFQEAMRVKRHQLRYPGISIETTKKRFYTYSHLFAHVLGYVGEANREQLRRNSRLRLRDRVGKNGVELAYDELLTGIDGERTIHIDHRGVYRSDVLTTPPQPGTDIFLTLDFELQKLALEALNGKRGSILMMDVNTGEILVYISSPSYDLNLFTSGLSTEIWQSLLNSPERPFLNRPVQGSYAPGSVFKLVTSLAALKHKKVTLNTRYFCNGKVTFFNRDFHCHKKSGHGWVDLPKAIRTSCNVFFWTVGIDLDANDLADVAIELGFGRPTGIDLVGEKPGRVPTPGWKKERFNEIWFPGDTLNVTIGQGNLLATPIQIVKLMAILATEGNIPTPHLLLKSKGKGESVDYEFPTRRVSSFSPEYFKILTKAMWDVVNASEGTGSKARVPGFDVCGKTGTAQLITFTSEEDHEDDKVKNAWFAGFAPKSKPKVAIMVLVEQAGAGGANAAPIARILFEAYKKLLDEVDPT